MLLKKIAYLASEYPGISHTFIFREIQTLRELGFVIKTASIRKPAALMKMTSTEKREAEGTLYIKSSSPLEIILAHFLIFILSPAHYFFMLREALFLSHIGPANVLKGLAYFIEAGILINWMKKNRIKHLHVHFANPAATVAMIASSYNSITFSISVHGPDIFYNVDACFLAEKIKKSVFIRCISYYCRSQLMRLVPNRFWPRMSIVRCGIDPEVYQPRPNPKNNISEILCVGRLVPAKGQHILLEACGKLKERGQTYHLTFIGDGEDQSSLESLAEQLGISDVTSFAGAVGQDEVHSYYDHADIFILASFAEGVPVVLMEAMAKEIPCISTRITGIPELIENGKDGLLVAPSNTDALADKLVELINNKTMRQKLGTEGRKKILSKYNLNENCKLMAELFTKYLE